jgi:hypothetical protein
MTILLPSGDHQASTLSPWLRIEVGVRVNIERRQDGCSEVNYTEAFSGYKLTLANQRATTVRVRVQNNDLRGLDARAMTNSVGMLGRAGLVASCLAVDVGKYIS